MGADLTFLRHAPKDGRRFFSQEEVGTCAGLNLGQCLGDMGNVRIDQDLGAFPE
jgi:hypothetical protein